MPTPLTRNQIVYAENLSYMRTLPDGAFRLIYIDPPFNTGKVQQRVRMRVVASEQGERMASATAATKCNFTTRPPIRTPTRTTWAFWNRACARRTAC